MKVGGGSPASCLQERERLCSVHSPDAIYTSPPWPSIFAWKGSPAVLPSWSQHVGLAGIDMALMSG